MPRRINGELGSIVYVAPSPIHGRGLFARQPIRKGRFIGTYEGPQAKRNGKYVLWVHGDDGVVEGRRGMKIKEARKNPWCITHRKCHDAFDVSGNTPIIWLGPNKIINLPTILAVDDEPLLSIERNG